MFDLLVDIRHYRVNTLTTLKQEKDFRTRIFPKNFVPQIKTHFVSHSTIGSLILIDNATNSKREKTTFQLTAS